MHSLAKRVPPATAWVTTCSYSWPSMPKEGWLLSEAEVNSIYTRTRAGRSIVIQENSSFISISEFSVAKATLESQMSVCPSVCLSVSPSEIKTPLIANVRLSVCPSVTKTPQPLRIAPIDHKAYQPSSLLTIKPINHRAYQPLSLLAIKPINH